jgi:hypothetical protein
VSFNRASGLENRRELAERRLWAHSCPRWTERQCLLLFEGGHRWKLQGMSQGGKQTFAGNGRSRLLSSAVIRRGGRGRSIHKGRTRSRDNVVRLSPEERGGLEAMIGKGKSAAARLLKARILLKADVSEAGEGWSDSRIVEALETSVSMVYRVRKQGAELRRMGYRVRRSKNDDGAARPPHSPLPHPRNSKRQLPLQNSSAKPAKSTKEKPRNLTNA